MKPVRGYVVGCYGGPAGKKCFGFLVTKDLVKDETPVSWFGVQSEYCGIAVGRQDFWEIFFLFFFGNSSTRVPEFPIL